MEHERDIAFRDAVPADTRSVEKERGIMQNSAPEKSSSASRVDTLEHHRRSFQTKRADREGSRANDAARHHTSSGSSDDGVARSNVSEAERRKRTVAEVNARRKTTARAYTAQDYRSEIETYEDRARERQRDNRLDPDQRRKRAQEQRAQHTRAAEARARQEESMERAYRQSNAASKRDNPARTAKPEQVKRSATSMKDDAAPVDAHAVSKVSQPVNTERLQKDDAKRLSPTMALELAAPHTWVAAVMPTLVALAAAAASAKTIPLVASFACLVIVILMQSAVNTINDYYDYVKGTDSKEDNVDPTDAVLVYNNVDPKSARNLACGEVIAAFAIGVYIIVIAGIVPLVIALIGALFVFIYSAGKTPISYLPLGEAASGIVMGGLIPLAVYDVACGAFSWMALVYAIPEIIGIGLIMMTNNTCDIERDIPANRKTLSVLLGRERARKLYHTLVFAWIVAIAVIVACWFVRGLFVVPFMLLATFAPLRALLKNPLKQETRIQAMGQICAVNVILGSFYAACLFAGGFVVLTI